MNHGVYVLLPGYNTYLIGLDGEVFSTISNKVLKPIVSVRGYTSVRLHKGGIQRNTPLHRILCCAFKRLPSLDSDLEVDHIDSDISYWGLNNLQVLSTEDHLFKTLKDRGLKKLKVKYCTSCGEKITPRADRCQKCSSHKVINPNLTIEDIVYEVTVNGWVGAGRNLGYSDNGLRKRYTALGGNPKELKKSKVL